MTADDSNSSETNRLLAPATAGDRAAFNELFDRYRGFMLHSAERRLSPRVRPRLDVSDVVKRPTWTRSSDRGIFFAVVPCPSAFGCSRRSMSGY